jgi:hypothetical protein
MALGWYGTLAILGAYFLVSFRIITPHDLSYQLLNSTGSVGILFEAYAKRDQPVVVLNLCWLIIGIISLVRIIFP